MKTEGNEFALSIIESVCSANIQNKFVISILEMSLLCQQQKTSKPIYCPHQQNINTLQKDNQQKQKGKIKKQHINHVSGVGVGGGMSLLYQY